MTDNTTTKLLRALVEDLVREHVDRIAREAARDEVGSLETRLDEIECVVEGISASGLEDRIYEIERRLEDTEPAEAA